MTDYTKLIERMRTDAIFDNTTLGNEAADAIEALQKEVSALDVLLEECKMDWSGDVTQLKAEHKHEIEELQSDRDQLQRDFTYMKQQRDTWKRMFAELQSKLDAMGKGEPVEVGAVYTIQQAKRLPNVQIKVTSIYEESCDAEYEVLPAHGIGGTP